MSAAETIQAAIDKLSALDSATVAWRDVPDAASIIGEEAVALIEVSGDTALLTGAETIRALHRTIDAQLAILGRLQSTFAEGVPEWQLYSGELLVLDLARAILGDQS